MTEGTATTKYLWDANAALPQLALERDGTDNLLRRYLFGHDTISMTTGGVGGADYYYHADGLGSIVNVTNAVGLNQWSYDYEPFGVERTVTNVSGVAPVNPLRYTGELLDSTGLYHLRARQYDPATGRFASTDPLVQPIRDPYVSEYLYVGNRPTAFVDPSGLIGCSFLSGACDYARDVGNVFVGYGQGLYYTGAGVAQIAQNPEMVAQMAAAYANAYEQGGMGAVWGMTKDSFLAAGRDCRAAYSSGDPRRFGRYCMKAFLAYAPLGYGAGVAASIGGRLGLQTLRGGAPEVILLRYIEGRGHHVPAKSAFRGAPNYDPAHALAVPKAELLRLGISHARITGAQQTLYRQFASTGRPLTWDIMATIEGQALEAAGMGRASAASIAERAIAALKQAGVENPTRIPWGG